MFDTDKIKGAIKEINDYSKLYKKSVNRIHLDF